MNAAPRSSRVVMNRMGEEVIASITWRFSSPGRPKTYSTPSFSRHETRSCATFRSLGAVMAAAQRRDNGRLYGRGVGATVAAVDRPPEIPDAPSAPQRPWFVLL